MPYHADTDESERTTGIGSSPGPGLSASEVRGEVELCVLISSPRTLFERRRLAQTVAVASATQTHQSIGYILNDAVNYFVPSYTAMLYK